MAEKQPRAEKNPRAEGEPGQDFGLQEDARLTALEQRLRQAEVDEAARTGKAPVASQKGRSQGMRVLSDLIGIPFGSALIGWLVDRWLRRHKFKEHDLTHDELVAEGDKSSGVLLASGYIAGGALAGIVIAIMAGWPSLAGMNDRIAQWAGAHNPFYAGAYSDLLALLPFAVLCVFLYLVGRDVFLAPAKQKSGATPMK